MRDDRGIAPDMNILLFPSRVPHDLPTLTLERLLNCKKVILISPAQNVWVTVPTAVTSSDLNVPRAE